MRLFNPSMYEKVHLLCALLLTLLYFIRINSQYLSSYKLLARRQNNLLVVLYVVAFIIVIGLRPVSFVFGDTVNYARIYDGMYGAPITVVGSEDSLFYLIMYYCAQSLDVKWFFLIIEFLYVIPIVLSCYRLLSNNYDIGILICFSALSFYSYSVNGIRNGAACSMVMLAMTFLIGERKEDKLLCILLSFIAIYFHRSAALPVLCMFAAFFIKSPKTMFFFWFLSIVLSLLAGGLISSFFADLGVDERLTEYIESDEYSDLFSYTGFRWDFLLYSSVPILLGYYLIFKKRVFDRTYLFLLGTYIYANSFWIMVIRSDFSNRFAYLSWFLYPIIIAYPILKLNIWPKTQPRKMANIMVAHLAFTMFMALIYW